MASSRRLPSDPSLPEQPREERFAVIVLVDILFVAQPCFMSGRDDLDSAAGLYGTAFEGIRSVG